MINSRLISEKLREKHIFVLIIVICLISPLLVRNSFILTEILTYSIFGIAFVLMLGYVGMLSFGHALFFGVGAYTTAILIIHFDANIFVAILASMFFSAVFATVIGSLSIRRHGVYFAILTLAFAQMVYFIALKLRSLTGGENGLAIDRPELSLGLVSISLSSSIVFYYFVACFFIVTLFLFRRIVNSPFGKVLQIIRENEERARSLGYRVQQFKLIAMIISGAFSGLAGALYCLTIKFVHCGDLFWLRSGDVVIITLIGGMGSLYGPIVGAVINTFLSDLISQVFQRWLLVVGIVFVLCVLFMRKGIVGQIQKLGIEL